MRLLRPCRSIVAVAAVLADAAALAVLPLAAAAQTSAVRASPTAEATFGLPSGALGTNATVGVGGLVGVDVLWKDRPLGVRLEGLYEQFLTRNSRSVCGGGLLCGGGSYAVGFGADILVADNGGTSSVTYLIAGAGAYATQALAAVTTPAGPGYGAMSNSGLGWNVGVGVRVPRIGTGWHTELRYFGLPVATGSGGVLLLTLGFQS